MDIARLREIEPDNFHGIPLQLFVNPHLLNAVDEQDLPYLRSLVFCKVYDLIDRRNTDIDQQTIDLLDSIVQRRN